MELAAIVLWLLFVATSIVAGIALWVSEHELRVYGLGVLLLLSPTFFGIYLYKTNQFEWLLGTSIGGIIVQILVIRKLAEDQS